MCTIDQGFRLCTCAGEVITEPDWILERLDESISEQYVMGQSGLHRFTANEKEAQELVVTALNEGHCFDFPYVARDRDVLTIKLGTKSLRFRRHEGRWDVDSSDHLSSWRSQMVEQQRGKID